MPQSPAAMHASHMFAWQLLERLERLADDAHLTRATRSDNAEALTIRQCCETFDTRLQVESVRISQYSGGRIRSTKHAAGPDHFSPGASPRLANGGCSIVRQVESRHHLAEKVRRQQNVGDGPHWRWIVQCDQLLGPLASCSRAFASERRNVAAPQRAGR